MNLAPPIRRFGGTRERDEPAESGRDVDVRRTANRSPARNPAQVLQRERHQPDYMILVVVVALAAIGILMVYSSSAMRGYLSEDDTFATVGPQIQWALLGVARDGRDDAARLPLPPPRCPSRSSSSRSCC